jgi:hypothetical protein
MILHTPFKRHAYARIVVTPPECRRPSNAFQTRNFTHSPSNALHTPSPPECRRPSNASSTPPHTPHARAGWRPRAYARCKHHQLGSRISNAAGAAGGNFLTAEIFQIARREVAYREIGALIDVERLATNLLSSMPSRSTYSRPGSMPSNGRKDISSNPNPTNF